MSVEVRKIRRRPDAQLPLDADAAGAAESDAAEAIGHAKLLTVRQFYYVFCFLTGACGVTVQCGGDMKTFDADTRSSLCE